MELKKFKSLFSIICLLAISFGFVSCNDDDSNTIYTYIAYGEISAGSGSIEESIAALSDIADYTTAISTVVNSYTTENKDNEVIKVCDKVYQNQTTNHPTWKGWVEIRRFEGTVTNPGETVPYKVIKSYSY